ncbi:hypothetical protein H6P81_013287 [Aristolochia fimbriata]|uniref:Ubiquitin thioesterase OTU n=1 Tax=Aristolochia fimbriata TaxID=158543 RepID=A0AAV7EFX1_ARIFI|nr:hypothetical protein H6P81_013287 [Aristolochia fimbriata]
MDCRGQGEGRFKEEVASLGLCTRATFVVCFSHAFDKCRLFCFSQALLHPGREEHRSPSTAVNLTCSSIPGGPLRTQLSGRLDCGRVGEGGIPGDGRCLFRSVAHGVCLRAGKPSPSESLQKELADELRSKVVDEFTKRRADTEWFLEGDFDSYIGEMRQPHTWGGEPELVMSCHVLQTPIAVYMHDNYSGKLKVIAEYGQEYGKENPIRVLYHGYGHYDALQAARSGYMKR